MRVGPLYHNLREVRLWQLPLEALRRKEVRIKALRRKVIREVSKSVGDMTAALRGWLVKTHMASTYEKLYYVFYVI